MVRIGRSVQEFEFAKDFARGCTSNTANLNVRDLGRALTAIVNELERLNKMMNKPPLKATPPSAP